MAREPPKDNEPTILTVELSGRLSPNDLSQIVDQLTGDETIRKISFEITTERPATLKLPGVVQQHSGGDQDEPATQPTDQLSPSYSPKPSDRTEDKQPPKQTGAPEDSTPRLQPGSDPFAVMRIVAHHDRWLRTKEIADAIPDDWTVSENSLGSNLWHLDDRGLVTKRPYEDDKRQNEYRITAVGERVLDQAVERAEDLLPIE